jgi:hypothetical protein
MFFTTICTMAINNNSFLCIVADIQRWCIFNYVRKLTLLEKQLKILVAAENC